MGSVGVRMRSGTGGGAVIGYLRSWWRWWFNPQPMLTQVWDIDGIGLVTIRFVHGSGQLTCEASNGEQLMLEVGDVRSYGILHAPQTLTEVAGPETP